MLETVLPAGVREQAGTRLTTVLSPSAEAAARLAAGDLPKKQLEVLKILAAAPRSLTLQELTRAAGCTPAPITALRRKGLIRSETTRVQAERNAVGLAKPEANLVLNADQRQALDVILAALRSRRHETVLLHGVTGSGKTEVYIQAIQEVVAFRPAGDRAGAGDQPHAANGGAVSGRGSAKWPCCTATWATPSGTGTGSRLRAARSPWWSAPGVPSSPPRRTWG